jgi:hypothetical protein
MTKKKQPNQITSAQRETLMAGFSNTGLLTIAHFMQGHHAADEALRDAAGQELFDRGLTDAPRYSMNVIQRKLSEPIEGYNNWGDELLNAITGDEDSVEGHFYRHVLRMEPPVFADGAQVGVIQKRPKRTARAGGKHPDRRRIPLKGAFNDNTN